MCGILGFYSYRSKDISDREFLSFVHSLKHRGPHGWGVYQDPDTNLRLGHRRLNILDLSENASQPSSFTSKRYWITYNGEVYNFIEIRKELESLGYRFFSNSDTEVVLLSYIHWKQQCLFKFNGMWAFAIWDNLEKKLFMSRDRFGIKPFYYYLDHEKFVFASEIKAFLALNSLSLDFDDQVISNTLHFPDFVESCEETYLKNTYRLKAGHFATFDTTAGLQTHQWWDTKLHLPTVEKSYEKQVDSFKHLFLDACKIRMRSDVPLATALSGGLDSSSVVSMIHHIAKNTTSNERSAVDWKKIFVAYYPQSSQDELIFANEMLRHLKADSISCVIDPNILIKNFDAALFSTEEIFDLPIGPWFLYKNYYDHHVHISLDGHGADELLGGYHHHVGMALLDSLSKIQIKRFFDIKNVLKGLYPENTFAKTSLFKMLLSMLKRKMRNHSDIYSFLRKLSKTAHSDWLLIQPHAQKFEAIHCLNDQLYQDFHQTTLPAILRNFDRSSMAHSVEIRTPFLDWRLVCYAFSLSDTAKIEKGMTKKILRDAMKPHLPDLIVNRKSKIGFANPIVEWYKSGLKPFIMDTVCSQSFLSSSIFNGAKIKSHLLECYKNKDYKKAKLTWEFIQVHHLLKIFREKKQQYRSTMPCN